MARKDIGQKEGENKGRGGMTGMRGRFREQKACWRKRRKEGREKRGGELREVMAGIRGRLFGGEEEAAWCTSQRPPTFSLSPRLPSPLTPHQGHVMHSASLTLGWPGRDAPPFLIANLRLKKLVFWRCSECLLLDLCYIWYVSIYIYITTKFMNDQLNPA